MHLMASLGRIVCFIIALGLTVCILDFYWFVDIC